MGAAMGAAMGAPRGSAVGSPGGSSAASTAGAAGTAGVAGTAAVWRHNAKEMMASRSSTTAVAVITNHGGQRGLGAVVTRAACGATGGATGGAFQYGAICSAQLGKLCSPVTSPPPLAW